MNTAQARRRAALLGLAAALLAPAPALAQEASPSPSPSSSGVCPNVSYVVSQEDKEGPPNVPVTLKGGSDVQPAKTPDRWTLTRISPGPVTLLDTNEGTPDFSLTFTASETTTVRIEAVGPAGCGPTFADFTRIVGNGGPDYCRNPETGRNYQRDSPSLNATPRTITAGETVTAALRIPGPFNRVHADISTAGAQIVSSTGNGTGPFAPGETATRTVVIAPTTNVTITWRGALYCGPGSFHGDVFANDPTTITVAPRLTLGATRAAIRTYVFSGAATTPGAFLNLYRVNADGSQVLTAQTRATQARRWSITRKFLGSGRFGFQVRSGRTPANVPGASNLRPTVIH